MTVLKYLHTTKPKKLLQENLWEIFELLTFFELIFFSFLFFFFFFLVAVLFHWRFFIPGLLSHVIGTLFRANEGLYKLWVIPWIFFVACFYQVYFFLKAASEAIIGILAITVLYQRYSPDAFQPTFQESRRYLQE